MLNADGVEDESVGQQYLEQHNNWPAQMWIQTSYNTSGNTHNSGDNGTPFRGNYAGIGYEWDEDNQIFWSKKPFASWVKKYYNCKLGLTNWCCSCINCRTNFTKRCWHSWMGLISGMNLGQSWDLTDRLRIN